VCWCVGRRRMFLRALRTIRRTHERYLRSPFSGAISTYGKKGSKNMAESERFRVPPWQQEQSDSCDEDSDDTRDCCDSQVCGTGDSSTGESGDSGTGESGESGGDCDTGEDMGDMESQGSEDTVCGEPREDSLD